MSKECLNCTNEKSINEEESVIFSAASYERHETRHEREKKRHWILNIILVILLVASNLGWIIYESQFETIETTNEEYQIEQDAENGNNNSIINGGEIVNGETNN